MITLIGEEWVRATIRYVVVVAHNCKYRHTDLSRLQLCAHIVHKAWNATHQVAKHYAIARGVERFGVGLNLGSNLQTETL